MTIAADDSGVTRIRLPTGVEPTARVGVLDVLRGIALLGMFFVHFNDHSTSAASGFGHAWQRFVEVFLNDRFFTIFGILFGAGFALQLRRADARGDRFAGPFLRRLAALAVFGFVAEVCFGYN